MRWFGESWGAPVCAPDARVERPAGPCGRCAEPFAEHAQGVVLAGIDAEGRSREVGFHIDCFLKSVGIRS